MERDDDFIRREEAAAADEARHIGGNPGQEPMDASPDRFEHRGDPAFQAVEEGGGGEAEGFEEAEALLEERATNPRGPSPWVDREQGADEEAQALDPDVYGESDKVTPTEIHEQDRTD